jgi:hypothetical protein
LPKLTEAAAKRIDRFLSPDLRHNAGDAGLSNLGWAGEVAQLVLDWFEAKAAGGEPDGGLLERAGAELARRQAEMGPVFASMTRDLATARAELLQAEQDLAGARLLEAELRASMTRDRELLNGALRKLQTLADARAETLAQINRELDAALSDE